MVTLDEARRLLGLSGDEDRATVRRAYQRAIDRREAQRNTDGIRQVKEAYALVSEAPVEQPRISTAQAKPEPWSQWYAWALLIIVIATAQAVLGLVYVAVAGPEGQDDAHQPEPIPRVEARNAPSIGPADDVDPVEKFARLAENAGEPVLASHARRLAIEIESHECDKAQRSLKQVDQTTRAAALSWLNVAVDAVHAEYSRACGHASDD